MIPSSINKDIVEKVKRMSWHEAIEFGKKFQKCPICGHSKDYDKQYCGHCEMDYIYPKRIDEAEYDYFGRYPFGSPASDDC
jgi:hypothetical protein